MLQYLLGSGISALIVALFMCFLIDMRNPKNILLLIVVVLFITFLWPIVPLLNLLKIFQAVWEELRRKGDDFAQ